MDDDTLFTVRSKFNIGDDVFCRVQHSNMVVRGNIHQVLWKSKSAGGQPESISYEVEYVDQRRKMVSQFSEINVFATPEEAFTMLSAAEKTFP